MPLREDGSRAGGGCKWTLEGCKCDRTKMGEGNPPVAPQRYQKSPLQPNLTALVVEAA